MLASRRLQAAESDNKDFKWSLLDCLFAVKIAWSLVTPATIVNCYRNAGFVHGDAEVSSRAESSSPQVASIPESELGTFRNIWDELNDMISKLPTLEDCIDVDIDPDYAERLSDEEIVVNNQLSSELNENENM